MNAESAPAGRGRQVGRGAAPGVAEADEDADPTVVAAAREAWTWRTIDAELAALVHDSTLDDQAPGRRPGRRPRCGR